MGHLAAGAQQTTIDSIISLKGVGVHSGSTVSVTLHPADADTGYAFFLAGGRGTARIPGDFRSVSNVTLCTVLADGNGATVSTVEHLLAALRGMGVDNVEIEIDGGEVPIMDGSAAPFVEAIEEVGLRELGVPRRYIKVLKPVRIQDGASVAELLPHDGFRLDVTIDFEDPIIGRQAAQLECEPWRFRRDISRARTFGFMRDVKQLWACGRALGSSLENTVAIGEGRILNPEGLRFRDEFARHKLLDAVGDLALAGAPLLAAYRSVRGGHRLNTLILKALYEARDAWTVVTAGSPAMRPRYGHAEFGFGLAAPVYAADRA
jgi:UDP-3-O-[3-hydroxymyristoyl] N-acetylglucosamine deacetylase